MSATADLLDVNVWLALTLEGHPHHKAALEAWKTLERPTFCRVTQLGFLRLLCNVRVMGAAVLQPEAAWAVYERLRAGGTVHFIGESDELEAHLKPLLKGTKAARDFWTDAYLAAFARSAGLRLVTFDSGFRRYQDLTSLLLDANK